MTSTYHKTCAPRVAARRKADIDGLLEPGWFKALGDPTRSRLLGCLVKCGRACSVIEISECCEIDYSVVARHLALLAREGLLTAQKEGRTVLYEVDSARLCLRLRRLADAIERSTPTSRSRSADGREGASTDG